MHSIRAVQNYNHTRTDWEQAYYVEDENGAPIASYVSRQDAEDALSALDTPQERARAKAQDALAAAQAAYTAQAAQAAAAQKALEIATAQAAAYQTVLDISLHPSMSVEDAQAAYVAALHASQTLGVPA